MLSDEVRVHKAMRCSLENDLDVAMRNEMQRGALALEGPQTKPFLYGKSCHYRKEKLSSLFTYFPQYLQYAPDDGKYDVLQFIRLIEPVDPSNDLHEPGKALQKSSLLKDTLQDEVYWSV